MTQNSIKSILLTWSQKCDVLDIELIIAHVMKKERTFIMTHPEYILTKEHYKQISLLCKKRTHNYPLAYILGYKEFYGRNFIVTKHTLVPRPETELLIEKAISFISEGELTDTLIIDVGTGSGIIAITLAKELSSRNFQPKILASDISDKALLIAKQNSQSHQVDITFFHSDLLTDTSLQNIIKTTKYKNIIIISNLPYVDIAQKKHLLDQPESRALNYEPPSALWSPDKGLLHYKKLISQTIELHNDLNKSQSIISFYEIDPNQSTLLTNYLHLHTSEFTKINYFKDLSDKTRIIEWSTNDTLSN